MTETQVAKTIDTHDVLDGRAVQGFGSRPNLRLVRPGHQETGKVSNGAFRSGTRLRMVPAPGGFAFVED